MKNIATYRDHYRTVAVIDRQSIVQNGSIARKTFKEQKIMSVLKANAYGHGIENVLPAYEQFTDSYAVATVEEGLAVRAGSDKPVLVFGPVPTEKMAEAALAHLTLTVGSVAYAERLAKVLSRHGLSCECHLKIETGLNRSGIRFRSSEDALADIKAAHRYPCLRFVGTYTHFACGEGTLGWEAEFSRMQYERFLSACDAMQKEGLPIGIRHAAATGASLVHPEYRLDMVRLGMMPLGMSYSDESVSALGLRPALSWYSFISEVRSIDAGEAVSYGCTYHAASPRRIAVVTCGYADGYRRSYSGRTRVLVGGKYAPVIGRIAMDYCMIDVTEIENVKPGDSVILLGSDGKNFISAQEISERCESVSGEVTCAISPRVRRIVI